MLQIADRLGCAMDGGSDLRAQHPERRDREVVRNRCSHREAAQGFLSRPPLSSHFQRLETGFGHIVHGPIGRVAIDVVSIA